MRQPNQGSEALKATGLKLKDIRQALADAGLAVTEMAVSHWRSGETRPAEQARELLSRAPFEIPATAWDLAAAEQPPAPPPPKPKVRAKKTRTSPGIVNAEELARDYLARCTAWREAAESKGVTDSGRRIALASEAAAIRLYASLSGQSETPETQLVRSPQWARLKAEVLRALEPHPKAARAVLAVLQEARVDPS